MLFRKINKNIPSLTSQEFSSLDLDTYLEHEQTFAPSYARAVAAIAIDDGNLTLAEFSALTDFAKVSGAPALVGSLVFNAIERKVKLNRTLMQLHESIVGIDKRTLHAAFDGAKPLIALQGQSARLIAKNFAHALDIKHPDLDDLPKESELDLFNQITGKVMALFKRRDAFQSFVDFGKSIGDSSLIDQIKAFENGTIALDGLECYIRDAVSKIQEDIASYEKIQSLNVFEDTVSHAVENASQIKTQIEQRLAVVNERIRIEKESFKQDVEDIAHDAGNAVELFTLKQLNGVNLRSNDLWEDVTRSYYGLEAERRLERTFKRREDSLRMLHTELQYFKSEMQFINSSTFTRKHHSELAKQMPSLKIWTRAMNDIERAVDLVIMTGGTSGVLGAVGAGVAVNYLGPSVVFSALANSVLVSSAAPYVGGAIVVVSLFKLLTDKEQRKFAAIKDKRTAIEESIRSHLKSSDVQFCEQIDKIAIEFNDVAKALLTQVALDAKLTELLPDVRRQLANSVIKKTLDSIDVLENQMALFKVDRVAPTK